MHTQITIDDELMDEAMKYTGLDSREAVIEEALRVLIRVRAQEQVRELRGKLEWKGDLNEMREGRIIDVDR